MKTIISKVMIILLFINLFAPFSAFASNETTLYNCGEEVRLSIGLYESNGKIFVHEKDVDRLNLYFDSNVISNFEETTIMQVYPGSSVVMVNGTSITFPNATVEDGDYIYIMNENIVKAVNEMQILRKCIESIAGDKKMVEQIMDKLEIDIKAKLEIPENLCWM